MRKFYCFSLLMLLSMALCGGTAMAQKKVTVDNIEYRCDTYEPRATVVDGKSATGEVVIPAEVEYEGKKYTVISIFEKSFMANTAITSVEIPASVKYIGAYAFYGCTSLVSITGGADTLLLTHFSIPLG
ncbi:MAG: leucine-rich repeat protein [Prevotellaceae bacterium]|nr:leucine-rich repeat protein [Prevotellaceae bacterium]